METETIKLPNKLITVKETAELFRVHPETIRVWYRKGKLKGKRVGHTILFSANYIYSIVKELEGD